MSKNKQKNIIWQRKDYEKIVVILQSQAQNYTGIKQKKLLQYQTMKKQQILYTADKLGYQAILKPSNDPMIVSAKQRNVQLGYRVCNQIYKGQSFFVDPIAEQRYLQYTMSKQQNTMKSSQLTAASTLYNSTHSLNSLKKQQNSVFTQSKHSYVDNQQKCQVTLNDISESELVRKKQSSSLILNSNNLQKSNCNSLFADEVLSQTQSSSEVEMLRHRLAQTQKQLQKCKRQLQAYKNQRKLRIHGEDSVKWDANKELGGTLPALMYMTVLMVLFTKQTLSS